MFNILKVIFVIIGTIIGAGFSSGQEIFTFFNKYGTYGFLGIFFSSLLIGLIIYKTFKITLDNRINTYQDFIERIMPYSVKQSYVLKHTINNIVNIFLFISFIIMVAGFSTFLLQEFYIPKMIGASIIAILTYIIFLKGINGVIRINTYLIPVILLLIVFLGIKKINTFQIMDENQSIYWFISSVLYSSYNSICLIPILITLKKHIHSIKEARNGRNLYKYGFFYFIIYHLFTFKFILYRN